MEPQRADYFSAKIPEPPNEHSRSEFLGGLAIWPGTVSIIRWRGNFREICQQTEVLSRGLVPVHFSQTNLPPCG